MKLKIALAVMTYFVLLIILVLNIDDKSKVIKNSFLLFMISLIVALFFVNELVMDYIVSAIIRFFYYPTFASIIVALLLTMIFFLNNIYNDEKRDFMRITNYIFSCSIFVAFIIFSSLNVDINSYNSLYTGDSLICLRYISRTFTIWLFLVTMIKYFYYFGNKSK